MMRRSVWLLAIACSCAPAPASAPGPAAPSRPGSAAGPAGPSITVSPGDIAITNVTVVPMSSEGELAHQTVVLRGDRIAAVAPSGAVALPAGVTAIDGTGKWLMPGLADMHVHVWSEDALAMFVAAGVTTIRNMFGSEEALAWRSKSASGELVAPTIVTAGPIIDGDPPVWPGSTVLTSPADAERVVAQQKAAGYDFLKAYSRLSRDAYEALAAAARRHGMAVAGHVPTAVGLAGALAAGQRSIEHLDGYLDALVPDPTALPAPGGTQARTRAILARMDRSRLPDAIARTLAAGAWNCPTLVVYDRLAALGDVAALKKRIAWLDLMPAGLVAGWDPRQDFRFKDFRAEDFATLRERNAQLAQILRALVAANAPILVGTDTGNPFVVPGASLHDEIELMVAAGLPRARVLRAATADAARYLGAPQPAGVVAPGARADLVLLATDPLAAPLPLVPEGVVLRGKWLPRAELEARLAGIAKHNAAGQDRWQGVPPPTASGTDAALTYYEMAAAGAVVGEERIGVLHLPTGVPLAVGQAVADYGARVVVTYRLTYFGASFTASYQSKKLELSGKIGGGKVTVTGTSREGAPISLSQPAPRGSFLSVPGVGGAALLAAKLGDLKPGGKRNLVALELAYFPAVAVVATSYDVERKPDAAGNRVFAMAVVRDKTTSSAELVIDPAGAVVSFQLGAPLQLRFTRRQH